MTRCQGVHVAVAIVAQTRCRLCRRSQRTTLDGMPNCTHAAICIVDIQMHVTSLVEVQVRLQVQRLRSKARWHWLLCPPCLAAFTAALVSLVKR